MLFLRRTLPLIVALVFGLIGIAIYYIPHSGAQRVEQELSLWLRIISAFAFFVGLMSLLGFHWRRIRQGQAGWGYSLVVYLSFGLTFVFTLYNDGKGPFAPQAEAGGYQWLYQNVQVPCGATMFSILAFFIASAAYRTFRARTSEATILLVAAVVVMLGRVPIGALISDYLSSAIEWLAALSRLTGLPLLPKWLTALSHLNLPLAAEWLMDVPNLAAKRGILLGVSLGAIATALRIIFGIERSYLGGEES